MNSTFLRTSARETDVSNYVPSKNTNMQGHSAIFRTTTTPSSWLNAGHELCDPKPRTSIDSATGSSSFLAAPGIMLKRVKYAYQSRSLRARSSRALELGLCDDFDDTNLEDEMTQSCSWESDMSADMSDSSAGKGRPGKVQTKVRDLCGIDEMADAEAKAISGQWEEALSIWFRALEQRWANVGRAHPDVALIERKIGDTFVEIGYHRAALVIFEELLWVRQATLGPGHGGCAEAANLIFGASEVLREEEENPQSGDRTDIDVKEEKEQHYMELFLEGLAKVSA